MRLNLNLQDLPFLKLGETLLHRAKVGLHEIRTDNERRWGESANSPVKEARKDQLRARLKRVRKSWEEWLSVLENEAGWQRLFIGIYLEDAGQKWLVEFDNAVADAVLGTRGNEWHPSRMRQVKQLFFAHFDEILALSKVCKRLHEFLCNSQKGFGDDLAIWRKHPLVVFDVNGPLKVADQAKAGESLESLRKRFAIPHQGRFAEKLRHALFLETLKKCQLGSEPDVLQQIRDAKTEPAPGALLLGAAGLKIMVQRVSKNHGEWPPGWRKWIVPLGCDPRMGRAHSEAAKWWGWASESEIRVAQQGITGLTLHFFIQFLERSLRGTDKEEQFSLRSEFLLALFRANKIIDARLVLNWASLQRLDRASRDSWSIAHLSATTDDTSMIALRCADEVFLLEGTHSYGLRAFHRHFPIQGFWDRSKKTYQDRELRISPDKCPIFVRHDPSGNWAAKYFQELRRRFHLEWSDVEIR
ncbi:MAG: EH signature domain-containing protein [Prosthecobacter sp.]